MTTHQTAPASPQSAANAATEASGHNQAPTPLVRATDALAVSTGRSCRLCRADISARRAGVVWCSNRCRKRAEAGLPAVAVVRCYGTPLAHPGMVVQPCPACAFPEADGGACPDCGWTLPAPGTPGGWPLYPAGSIHGPLYDQRGRRIAAPEPEPIDAIHPRRGSRAA